MDKKQKHIQHEVQIQTSKTGKSSKLTSPCVCFQVIWLKIEYSQSKENWGKVKLNDWEGSSKLRNKGIAVSR